MERAKVILHMMISIDGKIEGYFADAPLTGACGEVYDELIPTLGDAEGTGSYTACLYLAGGDGDYSAFKDTDVPEGDFPVVSENRKYLFCFDRHGKCAWEGPLSGDKQVVEVVTREVPKEFLAYLRSKNISYIFAGEHDLDIPGSLVKIHELFGVETLVLCGGATINGAFFKAGVVDGISQVIVPYLEGNHDQKGTAETDVFLPKAYLLKKAEPVGKGGVHLLYEAEKK